MIYAISGPLIAMILFIMPTLSTYLIPALKPYRSVGNFITLVVGLLCVSVMFLADPCSAASFLLAARSANILIPQSP